MPPWLRFGRFLLSAEERRGEGGGDASVCEGLRSSSSLIAKSIRSLGCSLISALTAALPDDTPPSPPHCAAGGPRPRDRAAMGAGSSKNDRALQELPEDERYFGLENFGNTCYCNSVLQALYFCRPFRERLLAHAARLQAAKTAGPVHENILTCLAELFVQVRRGGRVVFGRAGGRRGRRAASATLLSQPARGLAAAVRAGGGRGLPLASARYRPGAAPVTKLPTAPTRPRLPPPPLPPRTPQINAQRRKTGFVSPRKFVGRVKAENALFSGFMHQVREAIQRRSGGAGGGPGRRRRGRAPAPPGHACRLSGIKSCTSCV